VNLEIVVDPISSSVSFFRSEANWASKLDYFKSFNKSNTVSMASLDLVPVWSNARI
jgi:hypothetical protein